MHVSAYMCVCVRACVCVCVCVNLAAWPSFARAWPGCAKLLRIVVSLSKKLYSHCSSPSSCLVSLSGIRVVGGIRVVVELWIPQSLSLSET